MQLPTLSLSKIGFKNYRVFDDKEFDLKPITILTGTNSSGKSSIVKALMLLQTNLEQNKLTKLDFHNLKPFVAMNDFQSSVQQTGSKKGVEFTLTYNLNHDSTRHIYLQKYNKMRLTLRYAGRRMQTTRLIYFQIELQEEPNQFNWLCRCVFNNKSNKNQLSINNKYLFKILEISDDYKLLMFPIRRKITSGSPELVQHIKQRKTVITRKIKHAEKILPTIYKENIELQKLEYEYLKYQQIENNKNMYTLQNIEDKIRDIKEELKHQILHKYSAELKSLQDEATFTDFWYTYIRDVIRKNIKTFMQKMDNISWEVSDQLYFFSTKLNKHNNVNLLLNEHKELIYEHIQSYLNHVELNDILNFKSKDLKFASELKNIKLIELIKNTKQDGYNNEPLYFADYISTIINDILVLALDGIHIEHIAAIRGKQSQVYNIEQYVYPIEEAAKLLHSLESENKKPYIKKKFVRERNRLKNITNNQSIDASYDEKAKLFFLEKQLNRLELAEKIRCKMLKGGFATIELLKDNQWRNLADFGLGYSQVIPILIYIAYYVGSGTTLFIEEPGSHLHPNMQSKLIDVLIEATNFNSGKNSIKFVLETHSEYLMRKLQYEIAHHPTKKLEKNVLIHYLNSDPQQQKTISINDIGSFVDTSNDEIIDAFGDGFFDESRKWVYAKDLEEKLKKHDSIELCKYLILTEDENAFEDFFLKICEMDESITKIVSYKGADNAKAALVAVDIILEDKLPQLEYVIIHRDKDYHADDKIKKLEEKIKKLNAKKKIKYRLFLTENTDIEAYFLNEAHIHCLYPELSIDEIAQSICDATTATEEESLDKMEKAYCNEPCAREFIKNMYLEDTVRFRYGKGVYRKLNTKLKSKLNALLKNKDEVNLVRKTPFLNIPFFDNLLKK